MFTAAKSIERNDKNFDDFGPKLTGLKETKSKPTYYEGNVFYDVKDLRVYTSRFRPKSNVFDKIRVPRFKFSDENFD